MKTWIAVQIAALLIASATPAQVVITSFDRFGNLTWTNVLSNATYGVEWASSPTGAWQSLSALTNLMSLRATGTTVTVQVPMFYRVVWLDAPPPGPLGEWRCSAYDRGGSNLVATGRLIVTNVTDSYTPPLEGRWQFDRVSTNSGWYWLDAGRSAFTSYVAYDGISLVLWNYLWNDNNLYLTVRFDGQFCRGDWSWSGFTGLQEGGSFLAVKVSTNTNWGP